MFEDITYEVILQRMLDRVSDKFDKREGSVIWDTHSPTAIEFQILYIELDALLNEAYGDTASREFLILRCKERGIVPGAATKAVLRGEFKPDSLNVAGKRFNAGDLNYLVLGKAADGNGWEVRCEEAGTGGNQYFGAMIPIDYIDRLETAELTELLIPGEDEEETEALRERYFKSFEEKAFGGNAADYIEKANEIPGVGKTKVTRVWNADISPSDMIPNEEVQMWYKSIICQLSGKVAAWLSAVYLAAVERKLTTGGTVLLTIINSEFGIASDTLVNAVQDEIDPTEHAGSGYGLAPIGHVVTVKSASGVEVHVKTNITFEVGYSWNNLQVAIDEAISGYLLDLRKMWADSPYLVVRVSQIETRILGVTGIVDIQGTTLNGSPDNLVLGAYDIPIYGGADV